MNTLILFLFILPAVLVFNKLTISVHLLMRLSSIAIIFMSFLIMTTFFFSYNLHLVSHLPLFYSNNFLIYNELYLTISPFSWLNKDFTIFIITPINFGSSFFGINIADYINLFLNTFFFLDFFLYVLFISIYEIMFNYIYNLVATTAFIGENFVLETIRGLISFLNAIVYYSFTTNWAYTSLLALNPVIFNNNSNTNSNINSNSKLNPNYVTGFTDGEGCFAINIYKATTSIGWSVGIIFMLVAKNNPANFTMLEEIQKFFGVGRIKIEKNGTVVRYWVTGLQDCLIIREHFIAYPLMTYKLVHFLLWSAIIDIIVSKAHLTLTGLLRIVALKAHFPEGLSEKLLLAFPNYSAIDMPTYTPNFASMNIQWIAGFINADGSFSVSTFNKPKSQTGEQCSISIIITQHDRSKSVLEAIQKFIGYGSIYTNKFGVSSYMIRSIKLINKFIDRFEEAQLQGAKALDYSDFCKAVHLMNIKAHLTPEGIINFKAIAAGMNSTRTFFGTDFYFTIKSRQEKDNNNKINDFDTNQDKKI